MKEVIAAAATPPGISAMAVVRMSGEGSEGIVEKLMKLENGRLGGMRRAVGILYCGKQKVDSVVALSWPEGRSYTGEEMVELMCHGVPENIRRILGVLYDEGAREAEAGEFTKRAFLNGKMSAFDVMALSALWEEGGKGIERRGAFEEGIEDLLKEVKTIVEILEGRIEFGESHGVGETDEILYGKMREAIKKKERLKGISGALDGRSRVFIMGKRNTGKSTLLNTLAGTEKAVVSEIPGTTRDGKSVEIIVEGRRILLSDTAGTGGKGLDGEAERITRNEIDERDRIIWMTEEADEKPENIGEKVKLLIVYSKSDTHELEGFRISAKSGEGINELKKWIASSPGDISLSGMTGAIGKMIEEALIHLRSGDEVLCSEILIQAMQRMKALIGEEEMELCVERALSKLCVGK